MTAARGVDEVIWSPNGEWIVYRTGVGGGRDIYAVRTSGDTVPVPLLTSDFEEHSPSISPNNRWLL